MICELQVHVAKDNDILRDGYCEAVEYVNLLTRLQMKS